MLPVERAKAVQAEYTSDLEEKNKRKILTNKKYLSSSSEIDSEDVVEDIGTYAQSSR